MANWLNSFGVKTNEMLASAICTVNGQEVDCVAMFPILGFATVFFLFFLLFIMALCLATFIFWILMLIHAASKPIENRALWVVIIALTHFLGAIIYYFVVKRPLDKTHAQPPEQKQ